MLPTQKQIDFVNDITKYLEIPLPNITDRRAVTAFINKYKYEFYKKRDEETRNKIIEDCSIVMFAENLGYHTKRIGHYYTLKEHDSVRIQEDGRRYWRNSVPGEGGSLGKGGTIIDFAMEFCNMDTHEALKYFTELINKNEIHGPSRSSKMIQNRKEEMKDIKKKLKFPDKASDMKKVFAYLIKSRKISKNVVQEFVNKKMLYQDTYGNCAFVGYKEGVPAFISLRGTNTKNRFVLDCEGSDYTYGIYMDNGSDRMIVTESVIDGMSIMTILEAQGLNYKDVNYLFLCASTKYEAVEQHIRNPIIKEVIVATDNDKAGILCIQRIEDLIHNMGSDIKVNRALPHKKDWNEELQYATAEEIKNMQIL